LPISIRREDGRTAVFTANHVETYPRDMRAPDLLDAATPAAELRLITCHGDYDGPGTVHTVVVSATLTGVRATS
jgi:hypothetical protein